MSTAKFRLGLDAFGQGSTIEINGENVADQVRALQVNSAVNEITTVTIEQLAREGAVIEGEGVVKVVSTDDIDAFLGNIDPQILEETVLSKMGMGGYGNEGTMQIALKVLRAWARGEEA